MNQTPTPGALHAVPLEDALPAPQWRGTWWCVGVVLGTWVQTLQPALWAATVYGLLGALGGGLLWAGGQRRGGKGLVAWPRGWPWGWRGASLAGAALLAFALTGARALHQQGQVLAAALEGRDVQIVGTIAAMPQPTEAGVRLRVAVESAHLAHLANLAPAAQQPVRLPGLIDVTWYHKGLGPEMDAAPLQRGAGAVRAGDRWAMTVRLKMPHGARNPQGFDYELWLWEQGVGATGYVRTGPRDAPPQWLGTTGWHRVERARQAVRDAIETHLVPDASDGQRQRLAGVVTALVTGDQRAIERADWALFRTTGVAHLLSISGLHITLFAWLASALVGGVWRRSARLCLAWPAPWAGLVGGVLLAALYALFSGWGVPAQRTVTMLAVVALLRLSGRRWPWPQVWLLAAAMAVLADPWSLLQPGFWLSFVAVGVLFASNLIADSALSTGVGGRFLLMLREQAVVTLALTPLGLLFFGQVSLVGWVANVLAIPWVTLLLTPLALAGVVWAPLWSLALWAVQALVWVLQWLASVPAAALHLPAAPWAVGVLAVLGGVLLALRLPWALRCLGVPLLLPVLLWQAPRPAAGQFDVLAADVGQGSAVLVRTATHSLLYDAGPRFGMASDAGERVLVPLLRAWGEQLDMLVLSHRDSDHTGGAAAVLAQHSSAQLLGSLGGDAALQALRPHTACAAGQGWEWDGVRFAVLHPAPGAQPVGGQGSSSNAASCVLRVQAASGAAVLLAGDIEAAQEAQLVAQGALLRADVLLVPHHGSKTSSSAVFLDAVQPRWALVQAGYRNRFGHPAAVVQERLQARGIAMVASPQCGAAQWNSHGQALRCERQVQPRYWQYRGAAVPISP